MTQQQKMQLAKWFAVENCGGVSPRLGRDKDRKKDETLSRYIDRVYTACKRDHEEADLDAEEMLNGETAGFLRDMEGNLPYYVDTFNQHFGADAVAELES